MDLQPALDLFGNPVEDEPTQRKAASAVSRLLRDIAACREDIRLREEFASGLEARLAKELMPLELQLGKVRLETFRILVGHAREGRLRKRAREALIDVLCEFADELESGYGFDVEKEMRSILPENDFGDPDEWEEILGAIFGEEIPGRKDGRKGARDSEVGDPGDPSGSGDARAAASDAGDTGAAQSRPRTGRGRRPQGPKSKAVLKREAEEQALAGDIRALYLLLARALHPDKEADPARVSEKTGWMQKVTAAYRAKDLSQLLDILAANPLEAVGPYLSQAPARTVRGFAKRLRRELEALRRQAEQVGENLHPLFAGFVRQGRVDEAAYKRYAGEIKKNGRFFKARREAYRDPEAVLEMIGLLNRYPWQSLM